jgi:radical SAM superfamily enzyme YgiQ (UPF0313 family)
MSRKRTVVMTQVNYRYGENAFVPYSVGSIQAYAQSLEEVRSNFQFQNPLFLRDDPAEVVKRIGDVAVIGFSSYLWNWRYNKRLAQGIKAAHPETLVIFGGTHVPNNSERFFEEHPYVDILVHQEGELAFADILHEATERIPDYTKIEGLSVRMPGNETLKTLSRGRITQEQLKRIPSPYTAGIFDFMLPLGFTLNASSETNRGCPFTCTFCDWGGVNFSKVVDFPEDRILEEFEWFGKNHIEYIFNCDANYGIRPRDLALTQKMIEIRRKYGGFPKRFRMCTAKFTNDRIAEQVFQIADLLDAEGMSKGATLSFQSMDEGVLEKVKRANMPVDKFVAQMDRHKKKGHATYSEFIISMPGETYESTKQGIDIVLDAQGDAVNLFAYVCTMLPNSEMSQPESVETYGIKSVEIPLFLAHSTPDPTSILEYTDIIVSTKTMPSADWQRTFMFYWAVQAFHCLGLLQQVAILFHREFKVKYSDFYERFINFFAEGTFIGEEVARTKQSVLEVTKGGRIDALMPEYGNVYWPLDEASFLRLVTDKEKFYKEVISFLCDLALQLDLPVTDLLIRDVVAYQAARIIDPNVTHSSLNLEYNLPEYFSSLSGTTLERRPQRVTVQAKTDYAGDRETFAREVVWYGRKGGAFLHNNVTVEVL